MPQPELLWRDRRFFPLLLLLCAFGVLWLLQVWAEVMTPLVVALVLSYLLNPIVQWHGLRRVPRALTVSLVVGALVCMTAGLLLGVWPEVWRQAQAFIAALPSMVVQGQAYVAKLPELFPGLIHAEQIERLMQSLELQLLRVFDDLLAVSLSGVRGIFQWLAFAIIVPMMVFFLLKDQQQLLSAFADLQPQYRLRWLAIWQALDQQWLGYLRGKILECALMIVTSYLLFLWFELPYALLLAVLVGVSVFAPYIGIAVVSVPVVLVSVSQLGVTGSGAHLLTGYVILQLLDAYLLVPLLFATLVNVGPFYILLSILVFGSLAGFWGVLLAIPLASLCAVAWQFSRPSHDEVGS